MLETVIQWTIVSLCFLCLAVIVFAPSIYAWWFYIVGKKVGAKGRRSLKAALTTFAINLVFAYALFHIGFDYLVASKVAERDQAARAAVVSAVKAQERSLRTRGRFYSVGPVRGPYKDSFGLSVADGVIVDVEPVWDKSTGKDSFVVYGLHVLGKKVIIRTSDGKILAEHPRSEKAQKIRRRLVLSVR